MDAPKRTVLNSWHVLHKAHMINFAGWEMPIHYGSQLDEHHAVRNHAGLFDVSHMNIVNISGPDAKNFLKILLANNIEKISPNRALYSCMLNHDGGVVDDLIVYYIDPNNFRLILNAGVYEKDMKWLNKLKSALNYNLEITSLTNMAIMALQGPESLNLAKKIFDSEKIPDKLFGFNLVENTMLARTGYTGEDGLEIIVPDDQAEKIWEKLIQLGAKPIGLGARDALRLEAGLNLYGSDMDETVTPLESNLSWTVAFEPQDRLFIGREKLEAQKKDGIPHKLIGLRLDRGGVLRSGQKIFSHGKEIGIITSGGFSPVLNCSIAMARIENKDHGLMEVELRGKLLPVEIIALPFVKRK